MNAPSSIDIIRRRIASAPFVMLRYETEHTPCTGITAVTKQEQRHFHKGVMLAPWSSQLRREKAEDDPLINGKVRETGLRFSVRGMTCRIFETTDEYAPIYFIDVEGRFRGHETPYDTPPEAPENSSLATLKRDTLIFGLAVDELLKITNSPTQQFIWGADWETVPALLLLHQRHVVCLTLHNTFDECLSEQATEFGNQYARFTEWSPFHQGRTTALQVGLQIADVVTTVNRGFAKGMRTEPLQQQVMAAHIRDLLKRTVGVNNAAFRSLTAEQIKLKKQLRDDISSGSNELMRLKEQARAELPATIRAKAEGKALVVSMGRRVAQKQHDVLVESLREILQSDRNFPVLVVFATVHGDDGSPARLERIKRLESEYSSHVVCEDGVLGYYSKLMAAADFNCMPSLYEPHGGAFDGTVVPIARAVDGLAEQICALSPIGEAARINFEWHGTDEEATGFLFREDTGTAAVTEQLKSLLERSPSPDNAVFRAMCRALSVTLHEAVAVRLAQPDTYARLVRAILEKQDGLSWQVNLGGMLALVEQARVKREMAQ